MPRVPKPFLHKGWYKTNAGGKRQHPLCREEEGLTKARRLLNFYLGGFAEAREKGQAGPGSGVRAPEPPASRLAGEVHDEFLDFKKAEAEPATYVHYVDKLKPFVEQLSATGRWPRSYRGRRDRVQDVAPDRTRVGQGE